MLLHLVRALSQLAPLIMPKFNIFKAFNSNGSSSRNGVEAKGKLRKHPSKTHPTPKVLQSSEAGYPGPRRQSLRAIDKENGLPIETANPYHPLQRREVYPESPNDDPSGSTWRLHDSLGSSYQTPREESWSPIPSVHRQSTQMTEAYDRSPVSLTDEEKWLQNSQRGQVGNQFNENQIRREQASALLTPMATSVDARPRYSQETRRSDKTGLHEGNLQTSLPIMDPSRRTDGSLWHNDYPGTIEPALYERESYDGGDSEPDVYQYIVPVGVDIIFQDEAGNEIARVGNSKPSRTNAHDKPRNHAPIIVVDELGNELYRSNPVDWYGSSDRLTRDGHLGHNSRQLGPNSSFPFPRGHGVPNSPASNTSSQSTRTIIIDKKGNQIPIKATNGSQIVPQTSKPHHGHYM